MADTKTEKQKVKEITDKLEEGLKELFESETYKRYLSTMSKFHNYSTNNIQLIAMQRPDATLVAGYKAWQKNFERHVNKGERAIRILAPAPYKIKEERDKLDPDTGEMMFDENGMPQKEEVEIKIAAFRVVSVFDIGQTDGKPLPDLDAGEMLSSVEGYEDFKQAVMYVAPVPIGFEDIPGDSKGYFNLVEKRIAVQEKMAESQTLKTMIHETAHSMLHDQDINRSSGQDVPVKDRNTKEVEAESIAFTVCQHFGIDTSDYSFGYIAGWSTDRDMKELKSSLDTIRRTASELITGIEGQLQELQRDRELMQEQSQEFILAVSNTERTHFDIASVRGMEGVELLNSLLAMKEADRENVEAYLESMGAWVTHLGDDRSEDVEEFHVDYIYNTDTYEITDVKYAMEMDRKAKEPIKNSDVVLKIVYRETDGYEIDKITNMTQEQALDLAYKLVGLDENEWDGNIQDFMEENGAEYVPIIVKGGRNDGMPEFFDIAVNLKTEEVSLEKELSGIEYAASIINRLEYGEDVFSTDERNLIVNYAYKLNDKEKTRELAEHIYYEEAEGNQGAALAVIDAQAEIDALPDPEIGLSEMEEYGYTWEEMLPLTKGTALEFFDHDLPVYLLHEDGSETSVGDRKQITGHEGIFGIEKSDWENEKDLRTMQAELDESRANREAQLLYGSSDKYGIYQLKDNPELRDFHFAGTKELLKRGILSDDFKEIQPENYNLIYVGELSELSKDFIGLEAREDTLGDLYVKFNTDHPEDFKGHSLSVSDIVVLHENGENSAHFVDSFGFAEVPAFMRELEGVKEQAQEEQKTYPPLYRQSLTYAVANEEKAAFRESWELNKECRKAIEEAISENFDGMHLDKDVVKPVLEEYGVDRLSFILANTLKQEEWDARFSRDNVAWATDFFISEDMDYDVEGNVSLTLASHPAVLNGFIDMFRKEIKEREKEADIARPEETQENTQDTSEQNVQEQESIEDGDEIIDLGDEREQVLAEMKQSLEGSKDTSGQDVQKPETELAFQIADRFISIHETDGGYDYTIIGEDYKVIDGGIYDNPDVSIREALSDIVEDLKENPFDNGARGKIGDNDELIPIDYDGLIEKVEAANRIEPQVEEYLEGVREVKEKEPISIFNIRMNDEKRWFKNTSGMNAEGLCKAYAECDKPFVEMVKYGEWIEAADYAYISQGDRLDFSIEFNEETDQITIFDGENFEYKGLRATLFPEQVETEVTLTVAECGEFHNLGEFHENIPTVDAAIAIWKQIPPERMHGIPAIGINIHTSGTETIDDVGIDVLSGKHFDLDILEYIPEIKGSPQAMEVIAELMAKLPEMEIYGEMPQEMEEKVWEKRMPELTPAEQLAVEIDRFYYDLDTYSYSDEVESMTENIARIEGLLEERNTGEIIEWLNEIIDEGALPEEEKRAKELLEKLTEYKPLVKVEELVEENYNQIDNQRSNIPSALEENKEPVQKKAIRLKERKKMRERISVKEKLAEKKAEIAESDNKSLRTEKKNFPSMGVDD